MGDTIKHRRDTAANWTSENPTLNSGEIGLETDTRRFKIGDGSTAWTSKIYESAGRGASIVVAASDATAREKAGADYICDGVDDSYEIMTAIEAGEKSIYLTSGTYYLDRSIRNGTYDGIKISGCGDGSIIKVQDVIETTTNGTFSTGVTDIIVNDSTGFLAGQQIFIGIGDNVSTNWELNRISSISSNTLSLTTATGKDYASGSKVYTAYHAIEFENVNDCHISNIYIDGNKTNQNKYAMQDTAITSGWGFKAQSGIYLKDCSSCSVRSVHTNNVVGWAGIELNKSVKCWIIDNETENTYRHGILIYDESKNNIISRNITHDNGESTETFPRHNIVLEVDASDNVVSENNSFSCTENGLYIYDCTNINVSGNVFEDNGKRGIYLAGACDSINITGNYLSQDGDSIFDIYYDSGGTITGTNISGNMFGGRVLIQGANHDRNNFSGNTCTSALNDGICVQAYSNGLSVVGNTISGYHQGIKVYNCSRVNVQSNQVTNIKKYGGTVNGECLRMDTASYCNIQNNFFVHPLTSNESVLMVHLTNNCDNNFIANNYIRNANGASTGIQLDAGCDDNIVTTNRIIANTTITNNGTNNTTTGNY